MSFGRWSQTQEPAFLFLSMLFWRILVKSFVCHGLVFQGVAAGSVVAFPHTRCFSLHQTSSSSSLLRAFDSADFSYPIVTSIRHPCLLKACCCCCCFFFFRSEINCFFVCVWGVRTIIPSLDALFLLPWFEFLLKKLLRHTWNLSKYELFLLFAFFYSLWILMRRFHSFSRCLYFVSLFRCFFSAFLSFFSSENPRDVKLLLLWFLRLLRRSS